MKQEEVGSQKKTILFFANTVDLPEIFGELDTIFDSGCTNGILKHHEPFASLRKKFSGTVECANNTKSQIKKGKDREETFVRGNTGKGQKLHQRRFCICW